MRRCSAPKGGVNPPPALPPTSSPPPRAAVLGHGEVPLEARRRPAVARRPERLEREHHALADLLGVVDRDEPAEDRLLPDRQPNAAAELQRERRLLIREAELLRLRPDLHDLAGRRARADARDRRVEVV